MPTLTAFSIFRNAIFTTISFTNFWLIKTKTKQSKQTNKQKNLFRLQSHQQKFLLAVTLAACTWSLASKPLGEVVRKVSAAFSQGLEFDLRLYTGRCCCVESVKMALTIFCECVWFLLFLLKFTDGLRHLCLLSGY